MVRTLVSNFGTALTALALGGVVWVVAVRESDPFVTATLTSPLPIEARGLGPDLVLTEEITATVVVTMRLPESAWQELDASTLVGCVDLTGRGMGQHDLRVAIVASESAGCREDRFSGIVGRDPARLTVSVDQLAERVLPVTIVTIGDVSAGYTVGDPVSRPAEVTVRGAQSLVQLVNELVVEVPLLGARERIDGAMIPVPWNEFGQPIDGLTLDPASVRVTVPVQAALGFKELAVKPQVVGAPAAGYYISGIDVDPATVTVAGEPELLDSMGGLVETESLDISGAERDVARQVGLRTPEGASPLEQTVVIRVRVSPLLGAQRVAVVPTVVGLESGLEAEVSPASVEILLSGPLPDLNLLEEGDVVVLLDLSDLDPGTYQIRPQVQVPLQLRVESILPQLIQVVIAAP